MLLEGIVVAETHHAPVIRIFSAGLSVLVTLINAGNTGQGEVQFLKQQSLCVCPCRIADAHFARPSGLLAVFVPRYGTACQTDETGLVVIARNDTHRMVRSVSRTAFVDDRSQIGHRFVPVVGEDIDGRVVNVKVELGIEHTGLDIRTDQVR